MRVRHSAVQQVAVDRSFAAVRSAILVTRDPAGVTQPDKSAERHMFVDSQK